MTIIASHIENFIFSGPLALELCDPRSSLTYKSNLEKLEVSEKLFAQKQRRYQFLI